MEADSLRDVQYRHACCAEKVDSIVNPELNQIIQRACPHNGREGPAETGGAHVAQSGETVDGKILLTVPAHIVKSRHERYCVLVCMNKGTPDKELAAVDIHDMNGEGEEVSAHSILEIVAVPYEFIQGSLNQIPDAGMFIAWKYGTVEMLHVVENILPLQRRESAHTFQKLSEVNEDIAPQTSGSGI